MKLLALALLAMSTGACVETNTVFGSWSDDEHRAGSCHSGLFAADAHVEVFDGLTLVASDDFDCDDLGFSLEIPLDVTAINVTAEDAWGGHWDHEYDVDGNVSVGTVYFAQDTQPD